MYGKPVTNNMGGYRKRAGRAQKRKFSRTAGMTNNLNTQEYTPRGGIRL